MDLTLQSTATLNNGVEIPLLGLGTYEMPEGPVTEKAVSHALSVGYRHLDTAAFYANEPSLGRALAKSGLSRADCFVTTKVWNSDHGFDATRRACEASLSRLGLDYLDLYLIHWPVPELRKETWRAMEHLLLEGRCRAIGVSNYVIRHFEELFSHCQVVPAVNQIELSPFCYRSRQAVVDYCHHQGIRVEAYSPLTKGQKLNDPVLKEIAAGHGKTAAQVLIRWALQRELIVLPKSSAPARIEENANVMDFALSPEQMDRIESLDQNYITSWDPTEAP